MKIKQTLLVGAAVATIAGASLGISHAVSAATPTDDTSTSLVDKIATKFNLKKEDVQAVFDQNRSEHQAQHEADQKARLAQAVKDGKLTQAQADYITKAQDEIAALRGSGAPGSESSTVRDQIKAKRDALRTWATDNKVDMSYIGGGHGGFGGHGSRGGRVDMKQTDDSSTN